MTKRIVLQLILVVTFIACSFASTLLNKINSVSKPFFYEQLYYGGTLSLALENYTCIGVYPILAYKVNPKFSVGVKSAYEFVKQKTTYSEHITYNSGGSVFVRYRVLLLLHLLTEYETINNEFSPLPVESYRDWISFLIPGGVVGNKDLKTLGLCTGII